MLAVLAKLGAGGAAGFLIGLLGVWWVEPTTDAGAALLVSVFVAAGLVGGGTVAALLGRRPN